MSLVSVDVMICFAFLPGETGPQRGSLSGSVTELGLVSMCPYLRLTIFTTALFFFTECSFFFGSGDPGRVISFFWTALLCKRKVAGFAGH